MQYQSLVYSNASNSNEQHDMEINYAHIAAEEDRQCFGRMYLVQDSRQQKNVLGSSRKLGQTGQSSNSNDVNVGNKKHAPMKKQTPVNIQPQDTSIERPIWEVTSEKFWHHPGNSDSG
ncbi:hypothetical protein Ahy_A10g047495 [Arachis hypogaea]|uniref:Uncharacterized protein n=1 Tax=Arachis hypogaea TaxID=3818 RepID=A0A445B2R4_ARAHY|nr:hypothetical protein Ahy_A10g047495 [Arachis hypogaea]